MALIIAVSLALSAICFAGEPTVTITTKKPELNQESKECGGFSEDSLVLTIKSKKAEITREFCSSYGKADAKLIKDARGTYFLVLKTAIGRGTHVTTEYLTVYRIERSLEELVRFPVYKPAGFFTNCYYDYEIEKPQNGGLLFLLTLRVEDASPKDAEWIPKVKKRTILIK